MSPLPDAGYHASEPLVEYGTALEEASAAIILIHGRGDSARGILGLAPAIQVKGLAFLAPQARANTWYPYSFLAPLDHNEPGLSSGIEVIRHAVERVAAAGLSREKTMIVGFSQGACLAAEFVARNPARYGGLAILSGGLIGNAQLPDAPPPNDKRFDYDGDVLATPVFVGCSDIDPHIPLDRVKMTAKVFTNLGADVTTRIYPGMGHTVNDDEIDHLRAMVEGLLSQAPG
ncbi:alpha/beta hydrolase [Bacteroidota bacterium]